MQTDLCFLSGWRGRSCPREDGNASRNRQIAAAGSARGDNRPACSGVVDACGWPALQSQVGPRSPGDGHAGLSPRFLRESPPRRGRRSPCRPGPGCRSLLLRPRVLPLHGPFAMGACQPQGTNPDSRTRDPPHLCAPFPGALLRTGSLPPGPRSSRPLKPRHPERVPPKGRILRVRAAFHLLENGSTRSNRSPGSLSAG
jgi:hypothetical protein